MACRHRRGTTGPRPPAKRPPRPRRPRSTGRVRSPPRTAVGPLVAPPAAGPASALPASPSPALPSPVDVPSQLLTIEVLRRPVESAQLPAVFRHELAPAL